MLQLENDFHLIFCSQVLAIINSRGRNYESYFISNRGNIFGENGIFF